MNERFDQKAEGHHAAAKRSWHAPRLIFSEGFGATASTPGVANDTGLHTSNGS